MTRSVSVDPMIHFGKPCLSGTRIPVQSVLELIDAGKSFNEITTEFYPDLTEADIHTCLQYAINLIASEDIVISAHSG